MSAVQSRYLEEQRKLESEVAKLLSLKAGLLQKYALNKLRAQEKIFEFNLWIINGGENLKLQDLNIGDEVTIIISTFKYNTKTELVSERVEKYYSGKKQSDDVDEVIKRLKKIAEIKSPESVHLSQMPKYERNKVTQFIKKIVDEIVLGVMAGKLEIDISKEDMVTLSAIDQELGRIMPRLEVLKSVNASFAENPIASTSVENKHIQKALEYAEKHLNGSVKEPSGDNEIQKQI